MPKLTMTVVDELEKGEGDRVVWDTELKGFGVRVKPTGVKSYVVQYRNADGQSRRMVLGKHGVLTADKARKLALKQLGAVAGGDDPAEARQVTRAGKTISEICDWYLEEAEACRLLTRSRKPMKPSSIRNDRTRIEDHIRPLVGGRAIRTLTLERFQADIAAGRTRKSAKRKGRGATTKGGPGVAGRSVATLRAMLSHAVRWGLIDRNPALGVRQIPIGKRDRRLSEAEIVTLGAAMKRAVGEGELLAGIAAVELMLLTGFRRSEAIGLRYAWLDGPCVRFPDTKTGKQTRVIGGHARGLILGQRQRDDQVFVFPSDRNEGHLIAVERVLRRLCAAANIKDVTPHTLRHTFASVAAELSFTEVTIAALLGHAAQGVTQRYIHVDKVLVAAADQVAAHIAALLAKAEGHWRGEQGLRAIDIDVPPAPVPPPAPASSAPRLEPTDGPPLRPIRSPADYEAALAWCAERLANPPPAGSPEALRLETLNLLIATYEEARAPGLGDSVDALFRIMQSKNKTPSDLARLLGRDSAAELLSGARTLSVHDLRKLRADWSISPALLI